MHLCHKSSSLIFQKVPLAFHHLKDVKNFSEVFPLFSVLRVLINGTYFYVTK